MPGLHQRWSYFVLSVRILLRADGVLHNGGKVDVSSSGIRAFDAVYFLYCAADVLKRVSCVSNEEEEGKGDLNLSKFFDP